MKPSKKSLNVLTALSAFGTPVEAATDYSKATSTFPAESDINRWYLAFLASKAGVTWEVYCVFADAIKETEEANKALRAIPIALRTVLGLAVKDADGKIVEDENGNPKLALKLHAYVPVENFAEVFGTKDKAKIRMALFNMGIGLGKGGAKDEPKADWDMTKNEIPKAPLQSVKSA